jgi:lipopolysaccharide biosynthesis protein
MKRLLVIFHVWYHDQIDYFISKMKNINGCEWDLWVTMPNRDEETVAKLVDFKGDVKFVSVANAGYDIAPFVDVIRTHDISSYDYILKLHTKRYLPDDAHINDVSVQGWLWRNLLTEALLGSKRRFARVLAKMGQERIGMVYCYELHKYLKHTLPEDTYMLDAEAARVGIKLKANRYCAGSMFIVKRQALSKIIAADISADAWGQTPKSHSTGTLAHVYERLLCLAVADAGYNIECSCAMVISTIRAFIFNLTHIGRRNRR